MSGVTKIGKRGTVVIPIELRRRFGLDEGTLVMLEEVPGGFTVRPAAALPVEIYDAERRAAFLLDNAADAADYERAREDVRRLGLDPDAIPHEKP